MTANEPNQPDQPDQPTGRDRVWEVFRQEAEGDAMVHAGNLRAPDEELAIHYAREFYGRRQESHRLWVVDREAIAELDDPDLLKPPFDRSFKRPGGYIIKHKLEAAKVRAGGPVRGARTRGRATPGAPDEAEAEDGAGEGTEA